MNDAVYALAWDGTNLYAGGYFTTAGGAGANRIAKWNGSSWSALGTGMNDTVRALTCVGTNLYAGGTFSTSGDNPGECGLFPDHSYRCCDSGGEWQHFAWQRKCVSRRDDFVHDHARTQAIQPQLTPPAAPVCSAEVPFTTAPVMNDCAVTASFIPITRSLSISVTGTGTVHTSPGNDLACTSNCGTSYADGTVMTLTAEPGSNQMFSGWGGACTGTNVTCVVTMDATNR